MEADQAGVAVEDGLIGTTRTVFADSWMLTSRRKSYTLTFTAVPWSVAGYSGGAGRKVVMIVTILRRFPSGFLLLNLSQFRGALPGK